MKELKMFLISLAVILVLMASSFFVGRCTAGSHENEVQNDTIVKTDTIKVTDPVLIFDTLWKYKVVPVVVDPDTIIRTDTIIQIKDSVAIIPISLRTYTDSTSYKAIVSGYDPRLESIEIYQKTIEITVKEKAPQWSIGLQGGMYVTPAGIQPGIGVGINWRIPTK